MDSGPQNELHVDTKPNRERQKREKLVKVRLNAKESYLLAEVDKKLGFGNVSTTVRWLVEHFEDLERSRRICELAEQQAHAAKEITELAEEKR